MNDERRIDDGHVLEKDRAAAAPNRFLILWQKVCRVVANNSGVVVALAALVVSILILASSALGRVETRVNANMTRIETRIYNDLDRVEKRLMGSITDIRTDVISLEAQMQANHSEVLSEIRELRSYLFEQK